MAATFIHTGGCAVRLEGAQGRASEILNRELCSAENVVAKLRWLASGEHLNARAEAHTHHLLYVMEGAGVFSLEQKDYAVEKGSGIYLGPGEAAAITHTGAAPLKLFHLVVPETRG